MQPGDPATNLADIAENLDIKETPNDNNGQTESGESRESGGSDNQEPGDSQGGSAEAPANEPSGSGEGDNQEGSGDVGDGASEDESGEGYIADEVEPEEEPTPEPEVPNTGALSPELQYVVENLPDIPVRGKTGTNDTIKTFNVKSAGQLPDDFQFASEKDRLLFTQAISSQELKANQLLTQYQQDQVTKQNEQYVQQENEDIRHDIGDLQREGRLGKFQYPADDPKFNDDPAVKEAQNVINFMNDVNKRYADQKKLYRIDFKTAFEVLESQKAKQNPAQKQEDAARKQVSRRTAGSQGAASKDIVKPRIHSDMQNLMSYIDNLDM